eukprot:COSAG04_NODE_12592_length_645_cov_0.943223_1_plen_143_part_10
MSETALMLAAFQDDATTLRATLKEGGCELEARDDEHGTTAFLVACLKGSVECMKLLSDAGCDTAATAKNGQTALICAAQSGVPAAVRLAMQQGWCELEARDVVGNTAFLWACFSGSVDCMTVLADAGCDTAAKSNTGESGMTI